MDTTSGLLTTIVSHMARLAPLAILLAIALLAIVFVTAGILAAPAEPITVAPFRWWG